MNNTEKDQLVQNLYDAGCCEKDISAVMELLEAKKMTEGIKKLRQCRCTLMNELHIQQQKVDCLDYLIYQLGGK